ncbi:class I SAM-dependent methyltransferase [Amycolatopsis cihanbeyliensis]|uniref:tRNA G46 methylase TrmB n=1 Tax=Amycolatopsis cihanbeyliensis TaxID=1128664 RepID=A0A542DQ86_AMYCI|nr:class I SAM-dependent methyltransferase [Amycolatopsis cihanbeyliensis]TQJ05268.1 tRNA G46 methylase TrmB [Amycolatopsis cihanbeyliensis]
MNDSRDPVARIFNSAVAASAIGAAWEIGILDVLNQDGVLNLPEFAAERGLHLRSTSGVVRALASVDIVETINSKVVPTEHFAEVYRTRSFFHWLTMGSGELFRRMPDLLPVANRKGDFYQRDSAAITFSCREMNKFCYDPWFWKAVNRMESSPVVVADLGCGSGERLIQLLSRFPDADAVGIDIAEPALTEAAAATAKAGLSDRITLVADDVLTMAARPEFDEVELLTCFMMGHDFWPRQRCVQTLRRLREIFPRVERFLIGDATKTVGVDDRDLPVFTLGFEVAHDLMGVVLPTLADWESVFEEGGWVMREKHWIGVAVGEVIFELEPR